MDRIIEKKTGWRTAFTKKALPYWGGAALAVFIGWLVLRDNSSVLNVDASSLSIADAQRGEFNDYIRLSGQVMPLVTIQISPIEGGVVQEILVEEGAQVRKGDELLRLSNDNLELQILNSEAELAEKENLLRNTQIQMEQDRLQVRQSRAELQVNVRRLERTYKQQKALYDEQLIAREEYLRAKEDYDLAMEKLALVREKEIQDSLYRRAQVERMRESLDNMQLNMAMIRRRKDNLTIKAPIDGQLGLLDAVLGESIAAGTKIGPISNMENYKIEAQIDEHYIDKVQPGLMASIERQGNAFEAQLRKVYPEVRSGKFKADFKLMGERPDNIRNGQTYHLNLQLGQPEEAIIIPRGSFYQKTGGRWIYVVEANGQRAVKREIRIGRQNPQHYEVIEGIQPGERVIVSSYDNFGENDVLVLK
ncbi:MAG: HlyD family efflux transporter periplasmic adaptor subunit [Bacteroidales bacterium]|nr:HlyD family efflux transporter periplasmic adaptor subunit [Bacteroidales bacterium]